MRMAALSVYLLSHFSGYNLDQCIKFTLLRSVDEILKSLRGLKRSMWLLILKQNLSFSVAICKGIRIQESWKRLLVESRIRDIGN